MNSANPAAEIAPWLELAGQWQHAAQEWTQWWSKSPAGAAQPASILPFAPAITPLAAPVDAQALMALNAKYQPRFLALASAAQSLLTTPPVSGSVSKIPSVASPAPGDRRFNAAEWNDLPYFA